MSRPLQSDGRLHGVVIALRRDDGKWLIIRRSQHVAAPGKVCFPGGAIEIGETQEQAVTREAREELGLEVRPVKHLWRWDSPSTLLTLWGWVGEVADFGALNPDPNEVAEIMWMDAADVPGHPDALPTNASFCARLIEHSGRDRSAV